MSKPPRIPFSIFENALLATRDGCKPERCARALFWIMADGHWEVQLHVSPKRVEQGIADNQGNRAWTLPTVCWRNTDEDVRQMAARWGERLYDHMFEVPPIEVLYRKEEAC